MYCKNRVTHQIEEGDSLYKLARQYQTTVTELILLNAGVNPYNLQIGMKLTICPGDGYETEEDSSYPEKDWNIRMPQNMEGRTERNQPEMMPSGMSGMMPGMQPSGNVDYVNLNNLNSYNGNPSNETTDNQLTDNPTSSNQNSSSPNSNNQNPSSPTSNNQNQYDEISPDRNRSIDDAFNYNFDHNSGNTTRDRAGDYSGERSMGNARDNSMGNTEDYREVDTTNDITSTLREDMRRAWLDFMVVEGLYIISRIDELADEDARGQELQRCITNIADIFSQNGADNLANVVNEFLTEHVARVGNAINALKSEDLSEYDTAIRQLYDNGNQMAAALSGQSPMLQMWEVRKYFLEYIDSICRQMEHRIDKEFEKEMEAWRNSERAIVRLADVLASALMAR